MKLISGKQLLTIIVIVVGLMVIPALGSPPTPGPPIGGGPCVPNDGRCWSNRQCCSGVCDKTLGYCNPW
ncbi:unnamed protein product [Allacma fusca]|uniref:Uncharacterized protein n=1 Tax=Allacma fusca TaxID=39272 RepID=A0A8J2PYC3_9HEXA|nr:unnamed protein product [Allacma fusca]